MRDPDLATDRRPDERLAVHCRTTAWCAAARLGARPGRGRLTFARLAAAPLTLAPLTLAPLTLAPLAGALAGCGAGAGDRTGAALTAVRFVAEPELRIGSVGGDPDQEFMWFRELVVGPDGRFITGHRPEQTIRIHTADGRLLRAFGGDGEGPGEIRSLSDMGMLGDTLWVFDSDNARFAYYDLDGNVIGHRNVTIDLGEGGTNPPRPQAHFSDGTIRGASPAWSHEVAAGRITETAILRVTESGEPIGTVALPEGQTVLAAERGTVWGTEHDALDVPYIVRYGVRPAAPAADQEGVPVG